MDKDLKIKLSKLIDRRAEILYKLCHDEKIFHPEIILGMVNEVRGITKTLIILGMGENGEFKMEEDNGKIAEN